MSLPSPVRYALLALTAAALVCGQQDRATLTGQISGPGGAPLANVEIDLLHIDTGVHYPSGVNASGSYTAPNLPIGAYRLTFRAPGFKTYIRDAVSLSIAQVVRIDAVMEVGTVTESIEIHAETPLLQTDSPEVGTVLDAKALRGLPLTFAGGRYAEQFAYRLAPGAGGNYWESRINGSPAFTKAVTLDGADATIYIGGQFGESSPSAEAFEEFKIQTSGMSAEFGRTGGGVLNFVMKSGTNHYHGSALGLIHNEWMDANSFANNYYGRPRARDRRNNAADSFGGPVLIPRVYNGKDRTFFYAAYERYTETTAGGGAPRVSVPLNEFWNGDLSRLRTGEVIGADALGRDVARGAIYDPATTRLVDGRMVRDPFYGNIIPASRISAPARRLGELFTQHYAPTVKGPDGLVPLTNNAFFPVSNQVGFTQNQFSIKLDHSLRAAHKLSGSFSYIDRPRTLADQGGVWDFNSADGGPLSRARLQWVRTWYGRAAYDWTLAPTLLNHLQLGFNRQRNPSQSAHLGEDGAAALGLAGLTKGFNYPEILLGSNNYLVNYPTLGFATNDFGAGQNFQIIDTLSWTRGRHSLRLGADWRRSYLRWRTNNGPASIEFSQAQTGLQGFTQTGNGFASMLLGEVATASVPLAPPVGSRFLNFAAFVQDDFKVSGRLTLNLGLRWDYQPLPVEQYNRLGNWNTALTDPQWGLPGAMEFASAGRRTFAPDTYRNFAPRFGFAWQAAPRTALRGAYGIFFAARNGNGWSGVPWGQTAGFAQQSRVTAPTEYGSAWNWSQPYPGAVTDLPQNASLANGSPGVWGIVSYDPNAGKNAYTQQWNLNLQRELPGQMVIDIGYVGTKSTGIQANELRRLNQLDPRFLTLGDALGAGATSQAELPAAVQAAGGRYPFGTAGIWIPAWQSLLPYPQMMTWNEIKSAYSPLGFATYHALQVQWNKRYSSGLNFLSNYTFSKSIDNVRSAFGDTWGANSGRPANYYDLAQAKSISDADRTHIVKIAVQYDLPFARRSRWLGGWSIHYIGNYMSGTPLGITGSGTPNSNFAVNPGYALNPGGKPLTAGWDPGRIDMSRISTPNPAHRYIDTSLFIDPVRLDRYQRGNTSYRLSQLRTPWQNSEDLSVQKTFRPVETLRIQLRAEVFNAFNRTYWGNIETNAANPLFGQVTGPSDWFTPRKIHLGIRADW